LDVDEELSIRVRFAWCPLFNQGFYMLYLGRQGEEHFFLTNSCKEGHCDDTGVNQFLAGSIQQAANPYSTNFPPHKISH
jgi:hypothetical protein